MPAINVARTDTFETQRQKINQIGDILSNISAGGSDLQTGNLKLGDGTKAVPSLSFISDSTLGLYRPDNSQIGFVSDGKDLVRFETEKFYTFQDLFVRKKTLITAGLSITDEGQNYDTGSYDDINVIGGSGTGGSLNIAVEAFGGSISSNGSNYLTGVYSDIPMVSTGSGTGVTATFATPEPTFVIQSPGSGYTDGVYSSINVVSSGLGIDTQISLEFSGGALTDITVENVGSKHAAGDTFSVPNSELLYLDEVTQQEVQSGGAGATIAISGNPNVIDAATFEFLTKGEGHAVGDDLTTPGSQTQTANLPGSVAGLSATLGTGTTLTLTSTAGILAGMNVIQLSGDGALASDTTVASVTNSTTLVLSAAPEVAGSAVLDFSSTSVSSIVLPDVTSVVLGSLISGGGYSGEITGIDLELGEVSITPDSTNAQNNVTFTIDPPYGTGSGFNFDINAVGVVSEIGVNAEGNGYAVGDTLAVNPADLTQPISVYVSVFAGQEVSIGSAIPLSVGDNVNTYTPPDSEAGTPAQYGPDLEVIAITGGSNNAVTAFVCSAAEDLGVDAEFVINGGGTVYTSTGSVTKNLYYSGFDEDNQTLQPDLTLYVGSKYRFIQSDGSSGEHPISFSQHPDGTQNIITGVTADLDSASTSITVSDATGILVGMGVSVAGGDGAIDIGTTVESVVGTTVTLSEAPATSGVGTELSFVGIELTSGVTSNDDGKTIEITELTPDPLYYYCPNHTGMGGEHSIDPNNPKVFGSDFEVTLTEVGIDDVIKFEVSTGNTTTKAITSETGAIDELTSATSVTSPLVNATDVVAGKLSATAGQDLEFETAADIVAIGQNLTFNNIVMNYTNSSITAAGDIKTNTVLNVNDVLTINQNVIGTNASSNLDLAPGLGKTARVDTNTAFRLPVGNTSERPTIQESGQIRFNSETNQYEGYSATNSSWSSLGGVRDLDGDTTILAEESVGTDDDTLWFLNDNNITLKLDRNYLDFFFVKEIKSTKQGLPSFNKWVANVAVTAGQYLKYGLNLFEVTVGGITAGPGSPPLDNSGTAFTNGTATLQWTQLAVAPLTIAEVEEFRIGPTEPIPLVVNGDLRLAGNKISTDVSDLVIQPNGLQKVVINSPTSLVLPVGDNNSKGNPIQGSVRYNTDDSQFEGYNGAQWGGLGGVKDIDQDTFIQAETAPGADEDTLFFKNANNETLRLNDQKLVFNYIDTLESETSNVFNFVASTITFGTQDVTLDNTAAGETLLFSSKNNFDIGLSAGLTTDPLIRLTNTGKIFYNTSFGLGNFQGLELLNEDLSKFELSHLKTHTSKITLVKGTVDSSSTILYDPAVAVSAQVELVAHNQQTGHKEFIQFTVIDNGTDIYRTEIGNVKTGQELIASTFDFDASNKVRVTYTVDSNLINGNNVEITVVTTVIKR